MYALDAAKLLAWECVANDFWELTATLIATSRLMHVFGAWCFQCSGIPRLTYERHQRGKDTSCRAGATTTITPHSRRSPPAARSSQRPVTWSASSRTCSATAAAEGSAPRGNPILVPLDVSRRGHRRSCIEKGNWGADPVDLQGKRLFGRKVALVSVGANDIRQPLARRLVTAAARLAYYRSFRDTFPRDAMRRMDLNTSGDAVYPDLAFALPTPRDVPVVVGMVGVGVMDYHRSDDVHRQAGHEHTRTDPFWGEVL